MADLYSKINQSTEDLMRRLYGTTPTTTPVQSSVGGMSKNINYTPYTPTANKSIVKKSTVPTVSPVIPSTPTIAPTVNPIVNSVPTAIPTTLSTPPVPGSVASLTVDTGFTPAEQAEIDRINAENKTASTEVIDPNTIYQNTLKNYQAQIDALNTIYNDQLNQSRITNAPTYKARLDQNRIQQVQGGLVSSPLGTAQTTNIEQANADEQAQNEAIINERRASALASVYGLARQSSEKELERKLQAKKEGTAAYLANLNEAPARRKANLTATIKKALDTGVDISTLSDSEKERLAKELGVSKDSLQAEYIAQNKAKKVAEDKAKLDREKEQAAIDKTKAEIEKLKGEEKQKALDRALEQKKIDVSWYNAQTNRKKLEKTSTTTETPSGVKITVNKAIAAAKKDGSWENGSEEQKRNFIQSLGGNPSDFEDDL